MNKLIESTLEKTPTWIIIAIGVVTIPPMSVIFAMMVFGSDSLKGLLWPFGWGAFWCYCGIVKCDSDGEGLHWLLLILMLAFGAGFLFALFH